MITALAVTACVVACFAVGYYIGRFDQRYLARQKQRIADFDKLASYREPAEKPADHVPPPSPAEEHAAFIADTKKGISDLARERHELLSKQLWKAQAMMQEERETSSGTERLIRAREKKAQAKQAGLLIIETEKAYIPRGIGTHTRPPDEDAVWCASCQAWHSRRNIQHVLE